jgi:hypothetical protein
VRRYDGAVEGAAARVVRPGLRGDGVQGGGEDDEGDGVVVCEEREGVEGAGGVEKLEAGVEEESNFSWGGWETFWDGVVIGCGMEWTE